MSTNVDPQSSVPRPVASPTPAPTPSAPVNEVRVVSHSNIFYWWPVWAAGFIMALWTLLDRHIMVTVPPGSQAVLAREVLADDLKDPLKNPAKNVEVIVAPPGKELARKNRGDLHPAEPRIHMAQNKNLGVIFCITLLLVVTITNVPLRGMWSVVVIISIVLLSVIAALAGIWEWIVSTLDVLDIRINFGGYLFISVALFTIWLVAIVAFDRQTYIIFTPTQFKVCQSIGDGEKVYDNIGLTLEKQKGDFFRHYILGLGAGDLVIKTTGAQSHHFDLPNVLFIGRKVALIEALREKRGT